MVPWALSTLRAARSTSESRSELAEFGIYYALKFLLQRLYHPRPRWYWEGAVQARVEQVNEGWEGGGSLHFGWI
jgi:hypothetical protein